MRLPGFCNKDKDRHGNVRQYVISGTKPRRKIRIRTPLGDPGFYAEYEAARAALAQPKKPDDAAGAGILPNTMRWLASRYFGSATFAAIAPDKMRRKRRALIESCLQERLNSHDTRLIADCPLHLFGAEHVRLLRDRKAATPATANNRKKALSAMFRWALEHVDAVRVNPCQGVARVSYETVGFKVWSEADYDRFCQKYPIGTKERLAMELLLLTGLRGSDIVDLGPACVRDTEKGPFFFVAPKKTRRTRKVPTPKPFLPELARIIAATKLTGTQTYIVTDYGRPFQVSGFQKWFSKICKRAGLVRCTAHGLRKLAATRAAIAGATAEQMMSIFDWARAEEARPYIDPAARGFAAAAAMSMLTQRIG